MTVSPDTLQKLARYDTPTICNIIELFDVRPREQGYVDHRVLCAFPELPVMVGFAAPAAFRAAAPPSSGDAYGSIETQLEQFERLPGPPIVVFQDLDDPPKAALFGEVMCSTYQGFGAAGLVTNGAGRDLAQVRALRFPVFTGSTICSHGWCHILHVGVPVRVGGLAVNEGDLLHGDANGVTNIPPEIAADIADVGQDFIAAEEILIGYAKSPGEKSVAKYAELRREFQSAVAALRKRVAKRK